MRTVLATHRTTGETSILAVDGGFIVAANHGIPQRERAAIEAALRQGDDCHITDCMIPEEDWERIDWNHWTVIAADGYILMGNGGPRRG